MMYRGWQIARESWGWGPAFYDYMTPHPHPSTSDTHSLQRKPARQTASRNFGCAGRFLEIAELIGFS